MRTTRPAAETRVVVLDDAGKRTGPDVDRRSGVLDPCYRPDTESKEWAELTGSSTTSKCWAHLTDKRP